MKSKFNNGDFVKDIVSGYEGMIIGTTLWLNGCYRYTVSSVSLDKDNKPTDCGFDEHQLELTRKGTHKGVHETGGPGPRVAHPEVRR